jgi:hypothetical protein
MDDDSQPIGRVSPALLAEARLQLHWAAQAAAAPGKQILPHQDDFGEQSFRWMSGPRCLAQGLVEGARPFRSALRPAPPPLMLLDGEGAAIDELPLPGSTLEEAYGWLEAGVKRLLGRPLERPLERPGEIPAHPVGSEGLFGDGDGADMGAAFTEVGRWFAFADRLLGKLAARAPGASPVRCWPHHFDIATLIPLDAPGSAPRNPETARSIGVGLSPGDAGRAEPYFYVTPWPYPEKSGLPPLACGGVWNCEGWVGAVLPASVLVGATGEGDDVRAQAGCFLDSAVAACRRLLESPGDGASS